MPSGTRNGLCTCVRGQKAIGGIVHLIKTGQGSNTDVTLSPVILNSQGLHLSFKKVWDVARSFELPRSVRVERAKYRRHRDSLRLPAGREGDSNTRCHESFSLAKR